MSVFTRRRASEVMKEAKGKKRNLSDFVKNNVFYTLRINADSDSKKSRMVIDGVDQSGYSEKVLLLGRFDELPLVHYHRTKGEELVLCNKTFDADGYCPACENWWETDEDEREDLYVRHQFSMQLLPVVNIRRLKDPQINNDKWQVQPIYWLELDCTDWIPEHVSQWERFSGINEETPLHKQILTIFRTRKSKKKKMIYGCNPIEGSLTREKLSRIVELVDHPFLSEFFDEDRQRFKWDSDYYDLVFALAIVRFKPYVFPDSEKVFRYDGQYSKAMEILEQVKGEYPKASFSIDEIEEDTDDDEDEDEDDIPF